MNLPFTQEDSVKAWEEWGANCGPGALAAIMGVKLDEVRPHLVGFEEKGYTNPTMMWGALNSMGAKWKMTTKAKGCSWPTYGLARIQWEGPWTAPGVPERVAYRHTHWVGANAANRNNIGIFDINVVDSGWISLKNWEELIVPWLLSELEPKANGKWYITHSVEVERPVSPDDYQFDHDLEKLKSLATWDPLEI
jgi:hypothetical protein